MLAPLLLAPALAGCLQRVQAPATAPGVPATVPSAFFAATPYALTPTPLPFPGRYSLGKVEALAADDPRARYAAPLLSRETRFVQVELRLTGLTEPRTPAVAYELIADTGIYGALASGEWEAAAPDGATFRQDGVLLFVVPRDLRAARLEIVAYAYPPPPPNGTLALQRRLLAAFDLPRLP